MKTSKFFNLLLLFSTVSVFNACQVKNLTVYPGKIQADRVDKSINPTQISGPSIFQIPNYFVWGGSVIKGDNGKYHMLFSLWESGPNTERFGNSWVKQSKIGYAVSDYPDRNFEFKKIILKGRRYDGDTLAWDAQGVHNPHIKKFKEKYYLYYIGSHDPGIQPKSSTGEGLDKRSRIQQSQCIGVIAFDNFNDLVNGKFQRPKKPILSPRTRVKPNNIVNGSPTGTKAKPDNIIVVNPSVLFNPKLKKYMLYFKGNLYEPSWKGAHGVALGDSPTGPFEALDTFIFDVKMFDGLIASTEDPYVWYSEKHKKFMAVVKDFSGQVSGVKKTLALLTSKDGLNWEIPENPLFMKRQLHLEDGSILEVDRLERPQLLLDENGLPKVLFAASAIEGVNNKNDGSSFNVQIPLVIK